jgi:hypothetical protein
MAIESFRTASQWNPEVAIQCGPPLTALLLGLAIAFAALAGWSIERQDVR